MAVETRGVLLAGRYRVLRTLGTGGMASVFLCEDENLGRRVAVKRLHAAPRDDLEASAEEVERRFTREARLGASLSHPNLVTVFDTATDGESVLIVMEYVEGESLAQALLRGPLEPRRAAALVRDVAGALDHAHREGVVHRDVKPGNILIRADRVVKLVDLGIATAADLTRITRSGILLGTASYMAPEQLDGRPAGPPADIYALGAVAFEALSGRKARPGRTPMEVAHKVSSEPPPDLRDAWPRAPAAAADVLRRAMARDPDDRQLSATLLARDLEQALASTGHAGAGAAVRRPPSPPPARPSASAAPTRRTLSPALVSAALALLLAVGALAIILGSGGEGGQPSKAPLKAAKPKQPTRSKARQERPAARAAPAEPTGSGGAAEGERLNAEGFDLFKQGRYDEAIPILERAVRAFPAGTTDLNYAYALYNLGASLRRAGRPEDAIPILERRLRIPNQTATVRQELDAARGEAGG
jgi:eukaryotic-like serine/threonine-protein kinase